MNTYDAIYLSPHLDDVVLSCGGQIYQRTQQNEKVLIATITAGDPSADGLSTYAQSLHQRWELITDAVEERRQEDRRAASVLGADILHWHIPDCIYRFDPLTKQPFYTSDDEIFGAIHPAEEPLVDEIGQLIDSLPTHGNLYLPIGIGNHVDHRLTRAAAERVVAERVVAEGKWARMKDQSKPMSALWYYEEYPYAQTESTRKFLLANGSSAWKLDTIPLTNAGLAARIEAIAQFESQLSTFFTGAEDLANQVTTFVERVGGERVWQP